LVSLSNVGDRPAAGRQSVAGTRDLVVSIVAELGEGPPGRVVDEWLDAASPDREAVLRALNRQVAVIDRLINDQVNVILHHPTFQRLEASWQGLAFLARRPRREGGPATKVKVLDVSWSELARDFERAIDFDQSGLFRKVYEHEFGSPGGEPFGALIGDYAIGPRPSARSPYDDLDVLQSISGVAAAAFCPFFANTSPEMFGLDDFTGLQQTLDHAHHLRTQFKWQALREYEDSRFVGLVLPRIIMRLPYKPDPWRADGFCFTEDVSGPEHDKYLWGGAVFALGAVILRAFENSAWPADIRGVQRGLDVGGLVNGLLVDEPGTDTPGVVPKFVTDVVITDTLEKQLGDLGFIALCHTYGAPYAAFYSVPSIQSPRHWDRRSATANAKISSLIPYMLCVSRFAHYIKVMARDRVGAAVTADQLESVLQQWLMRYVVNDDNASPETKARNPLREANVRIVDKPGVPGSYRCVIHLVPHYELDDVAVRVRLTTEIDSPRIG
jgi:type VI secretion system ImpC/EvpB family protein